MPTPLTLVLLPLLAQGYMKHDTRALEFASADGKLRLAAALVSEVSTLAEPPCTLTGKGTYTLLRESAPVWRRDYDFALDEARVLGDGRVVGVAYGESLARDQEALRIVSLTPNGTLAIDHRLAVEALGRDPAGCLEHLRGWSVDEEQHRLVAWYWLVSRAREEWLAWDLATGKPFPWRPALDADGVPFGCAGLAVVPGTGLTLVHAWVRAERPTLHRSEYDLVDADGRRVWSFRVDADHVEGDPGRPVPGANGILGVDPGPKPTFRVRCFTARQTVRFELAQDPTTKAWTARELDRG